MNPGLAGPAAPADPDLGQGLGGRVDRVVLGPVDPVGLAVLAHIGDPADRADLAGRVDPAAQVVLADPDPVDRVDNPADRAHLAHRERRADRVDLTDIKGRADLVDQVDQVDRADPAARDPEDRLDQQRRRSRPRVLSTEAAPRWVAPRTRRAASAHPATEHRRRPFNTDSAGMTGLHLECRRVTGTDRRPQVAGTVPRLPEVGTGGGTGRRTAT
jgi:hypothetical protein